MAADQLARIRAAVLARPHLDHEDFARAVQIFGWPSDAARGCLLGLVRVAWGAPAISVTESWVGGGDLIIGVKIGSNYQAWIDHDDSYSLYKDFTAALEASPTEAP